MLLLLVLLSIIPLTLLNAWVLSTLWGWFIVTAFPGVPDLGIGTAIGLSLVVSCLVPTPSVDDDEIVGALVNAVTRSLLLLGMGWVVHQFVGGA